jgi:putative flippase GtrA
VSQRSLRGSPRARFASFATVGFLGFIVDATLLSTLVHAFGWNHYAARAVSFIAAVTITWYLNRTWVFLPSSDGTREYGAYFSVQSVGAAINLGTYALAVAALPLLARVPVVPLAAGAALALLFNYSAASRWVFEASSREPSK